MARPYTFAGKSGAYIVQLKDGGTVTVATRRDAGRYLARFRQADKPSYGDWSKFEGLREARAEAQRMARDRLRAQYAIYIVRGPCPCCGARNSEFGPRSLNSTGRRRLEALRDMRARRLALAFASVPTCKLPDASCNL